MNKAEVHATAEAEEEKEKKSSHRSHRNSKLDNRHRNKQRLKRERQEDVSNVRATTKSASVLITPQIKNHSCLSKPRRGGTTEMVVMKKITTLMENTTMVFVDSTRKNLKVIWKELDDWQV